MSAVELAQAMRSEDQTGEHPWRRVMLMGVLLGIGIAAILLYAWSADDVVVIFGAGLLFAVAALAAGVLLGFLFGVPRTLTSEATETAGGKTPFSSIRANTNLEQISDWLTKILVGITLVQLPTIRDGAVNLFDALGPALGGRPESPAVAGGITIYFSVLGFLAGWLTTRLLLGRLMSRADQATLIWAKADEREEAGDREGAEMLRREAIQVAEAPTVSRAEDYTATRTAMTPGRERTAVLERIVAAARKEAASQPPSEAMNPSEIDDAWAEADDGERAVLLGMMQGRPDSASFLATIDALTSSRSAFEQYHALELARRLLPRLTAEQREDLELAIERQRAKGGWIQQGTDRWLLADRILKELKRN